LKNINSRSILLVAHGTIVKQDHESIPQDQYYDNAWNDEKTSLDTNRYIKLHKVNRSLSSQLVDGVFVRSKTEISGERRTRTALLAHPCDLNQAKTIGVRTPRSHESNEEMHGYERP
jgi:hypothetical protein